MFVVSQMHLAEVDLQIADGHANDRCIVVVLEDFESYLFRKQTSQAPHCFVRRLDPSAASEAKRRYVDTLITALFSFTSTTFAGMSFDVFIKTIDVVDYILMLMPFAVDMIAGRSFATLKAIADDDSMTDDDRAAAYANVNRIVARLMLIDRRYCLTADNDAWQTIVKMIAVDVKDVKYHHVFCYGILLVIVGECVIESTDLSLANLIGQLSISPSAANQGIAGQSISVVVRVIDMLTVVVKSLNFNVADVNDIIRDNIADIINSNDEIDAKV